MRNEDRLRTCLLGLASLCLLTAAFSPGANAQGSIIDLRTPLKSSSNALGITPNAITGYFGTTPFVYSNGNLYPLNLPAGYASGVATEVGSSLSATGSVIDASGNSRAILWQPYASTLLDTLGGKHSWAYGINPWNQIVGASELPASGGKTITHAFMWDSANGTVDLTPGQGNSSANGINAWGDIVGQVTVGTATHAALWDGDGFHDLGTLGGPNSVANAISDGGVVVGSSLKTANASSQTGFRWDALYGMTPLPPLPGDVSSVATATAEVFCAGYSIDSKGNHRAVGWNYDSDFVDGSTIDLNTLLTPGTGWTLQEIHGIAEDSMGNVIGLAALGTYKGQARGCLLVGQHLHDLGNSSYTIPGGLVWNINVNVADLQGSTVNPNNGPFPLPLTVTCTNKSVTVEPNATKSIQLRTRPVTANVTGILTATCSGISVSTTITVRPIGVNQFYLAGASVKGGNNITGTVRLEGAAEPGPITVSFKSDHPTIIPAPAAITIPQGAGRATVNFKTVKPTTSPTLVTLTATANGVSATTQIQVN